MKGFNDDTKIEREKHATFLKQAAIAESETVRAFESGPDRYGHPVDMLNNWRLQENTDRLIFSSISNYLDNSLDYGISLSISSL